MQNYGLNELREMFLAFYESKNHLRLPSFSLVPQGDKSLLLINSGMAPMKPWFTGEQKPPSVRVTTCQKCVRTGDIENIGKTSRHGTYFEMLGNFSFGDYFKSEALAWYWEFLTECVGIDPALLYPSVYLEDDEAFDIWVSEVGIAPERITRLGKEDNFWEHGAGPCGPSSEVYYDRGEKYGCGKPDCKPGCECDRFIEIGNNVFSQFSNDGAGNYTELSQKNIDFGGGLERLAIVCQGVESLFDVDTIIHITNKVSEITGARYGESPKKDVSLRIITDHLRASVMLIADGVLPSNEGRGYVLRRLLRRAARNGRLLGAPKEFLTEVVPTVIEINESAYPEVRDRADHILRVVKAEEESFNKTIDQGLELIENVFASTSGSIVSGADAFRLFDTFGFPIDLTIELSEERGKAVDLEEFERLMSAQRERAREARKTLGDLGWEGFDFGDQTETEFVGYDETMCEAKITHIIVDGEFSDYVSHGEAIIVLDKTPFYAEMGGQVSDHGFIIGRSADYTVKTIQKTKGGKFLHYVSFHQAYDEQAAEQGFLRVHDTVKAVVAETIRNAIRRAHTATHLLHAALHKLIGEHVNQAGSLVEQDRLRFDFTHFEALTTEQLANIESTVNTWILDDFPVATAVKSIEEAKREGATALFGEKYGDTVRVVKIGDGISVELCGGTHLSNTGRAGYFRITSESSVAAGVRRIEAATGLQSIDDANTDKWFLSRALEAVKAGTPEELTSRIEQNIAELRELRRELESHAAKDAGGDAQRFLASARDISGLRVLTASLRAFTPDRMRLIGDALRERDESVVAVLASTDGEKITFFAVCGKAAVKAGIKAGDIIKQVSAVAGGSGGGKPESAMGGGKDIFKVDNALAIVDDYILEALRKKETNNV